MKIIKNYLMPILFVLASVIGKQAMAEDYKVSFNCAKARGFVESTICANAELQQLDGLLSKLYRTRFGWQWGTDAGLMKKEQNQWLKYRNLCKTEYCIEQAYRERITELCEQGVVYGAHPQDCPEEFM